MKKFLLLTAIAVAGVGCATQPANDGGQTIAAPTGVIPQGILTITNREGKVLVKADTATFDRPTIDIWGRDFDGQVDISIVDGDQIVLKQRLNYRPNTTVTLHYWRNTGKFLLEDNTVDYF